MYYELYMDVLFFTNFMMDSLLLLAVKKEMRCPVPYVRVFLGGAVGSGLTCLLIAVPLPVWIKQILFYLAVNKGNFYDGSLVGEIKYRIRQRKRQKEWRDQWK